MNDRTPEVVVVGAGPAGLAAATTAARHGAAVLLLDERPEPGGQLCYRLSPIAARSGEAPGSPRELLARLLADATSAGVEVMPGAVAWGRFEDGSLGVSRGSEPLLLRPGATIICAGSTDLPLPFPGWSLPGVFSGRAAQILVTQWRVLPGRRWAVVGGGPESGEIAGDLRAAGAAVAVVAAPGAALAAEAGADSAIAALVADGARHALDGIAVAAGRQPDAALATMSGVPMAYAAEFGGLVPLLDAAGRTADPRLLAAGDAAGTCTPEVALAEGRIAGVAAAHAVGKAGEADVAAALAAEQPLLADRQRVRRALEPVYEQVYR